MSNQEQDYYSLLRPYQKEAVDKMAKSRRYLLADTMGLGKTLSALAAVEKVHEQSSSYVREQRVLILCPKFALYVWQGEIDKWIKKSSVVYSGTKPQRKKLFNKTPASVHYVITTYGMLDEVNCLYEFTAVIADEIHGSGLLNHKSDTYELFKSVSKAQQFECMFLLTGTPVRKGCIDLYAPLSLLESKVFNSYWSFVNKYCITIETPFGKSIERRPKDVEAFRRMLSNYMVRRDVKEVLTELPDKNRQTIFVEMSKEQRVIYDELVNDFMSLYAETPIIAPNKMTVIMRLRQLLCCPKMLDPELPYGSALDAIGERVEDLLCNDKPVVIFTPFSKALDWIEKYLSDTISVSYELYIVRGGLTAKEFATQWQGFEYSKSRKKILLCVIKSGAAFHATTAAHAFFLGYEWDFNLNEQSEARLHRMGQKEFVNIFYMMHKGTVDEDVATKLNDKVDAANWAIGSEQQYQVLLERFGIKRTSGQIQAGSEQK